MTFRQAYLETKSALEAAGITDDAGFEAGELLRLSTGTDYRLQDPAAPLGESAEEKLKSLTARRVRRCPLQYIEGSWPFYGLELSVGEGVLIPRADTETVVEVLIDALKDVPAPKILDLCAGTGAIGLAAAANLPGAELTSVELSPEAMAYCRANAAKYCPGSAQIRADVFGFEKQAAPGSFDAVVCNPPYVTEDEYRTLEPELAFEPKMALTAPENGLAFYRYIPAAYRNLLKPGGVLVFEIGAAQRQSVLDFMAAAGYDDLACRKDYGGNDRCVCGRKPKAN